MEFAYGELGLSPSELAGLTPFMFELKCKGYNRLRLRDEENFRKLGYLMFSIHVDPKEAKKYTINDVWPTRETVKKAKQRNQNAKSIVNSTLAKFMKKQGLK